VSKRITGYQKDAIKIFGTVRCADKYPGVAKARMVRPPIVALLFFLVAHAWIAFGFKPGMSDTRLYAIYAFVTSNARLAGQSPYDYYEGVKRQISKGDARSALQPDEVTIEYPPLALELCMPRYYS
jgi:hypothetical protein